MSILSREPLHRTGNALIANSGVTALLGVVFWTAAARGYSPADVGLNSTAISAMMMVAGFAQLNFMSVMVRFLPTAGREAAWLVGTGYAVAAVTTALASCVFMVVVRGWLPALAGFFVSWPLVVWFIVSTVLWSVFVIQDSVLAGLGRPEWVPAENAVHSLTKLVLVICLVPVFPHQGVFLSWTVAVLAAAVPVNLLLVTRLLPHHARRALPGDGLPPLARIGRFMVGDYATAACWVAATTVPAQLVLKIQGSDAAATFSVAWVIGNSLFSVSSAVGQGLVVQGAREPAHLGRLRVKAWQHAFGVLVPVVVITVLAAPFLLRVFGDLYAEQGTALLRLLALSALPNAVVTLTISELRVGRRVLSAFCVMGSSAVLVIVLTWRFLTPFGVVGTGLAWLVAQSVVAGLALRLRHSRRGWPSGVG